MTVRLVVCDIDGTLLNSSSEVSARTKSAVRAVLDAGCLFILATGRRYPSAKRIAAQLDVDLPLIVHNGAQIRDALTGEMLFQMLMDQAAAASVIDHLWHAGVQPIVFCGVDSASVVSERVFAGPESRDSMHNAAYLVRNSALRQATLRDLQGVQTPIEVAALEQRETVESLAATLHHPLLHDVTSLSGPHAAMLEIIAAGVSKASALHVLCARFGVAIQDTLAIGDNVNDLEMLHAAGTSVAMANAHPAVLTSAIHLTCSNDDDGVAVAIERHVLGHAVSPR
jgi:hypothetical protein